jgi:ubiquinone/menaquinone biosynthesis C-methylase UbiE
MPFEAEKKNEDRFTGLAESYASYRPLYPDSALDWIVARCGLTAGSVLADVGSGTGISSRSFAKRGLRVIGIEPNSDMRKQAESFPGNGLTYVDGRAEATGLADNSIDIVLAAQAFHWFEPDLALREAHRILKRDGWLALMSNERDPSEVMTAAFGEVVQSFPDASRIEEQRRHTADVLLSSRLFQDVEHRRFGNQQRLDEAGLVGRALSASYAPRDRKTRAEVVATIGAIFDKYQCSGSVVLHYLTDVCLARRRNL